LKGGVLMIRRQYYLDKIKPFLGKGIVKAITGLRRVGKSVFVRQLIELLGENGVPQSNIIYIDKESMEFDFIRDYKDLYRFVEDKSQNIIGKIHIFVDEIQDIDQWERAVASWSGKNERYDVIITGSNSTMFSGELSTKLTGRYVEFPVFPLSFSEFQNFYPEYKEQTELFKKYLRYGGMPGLRILDTLTDDSVFSFLSSLHDSIVLKDIIRRKGFRNASLFDSICEFAYSNIGNPITANSIAAYLKNQRINTNVQSVINYMSALEDAQLFFKVARYDIKGKKILDINSKYYATDLGLRHMKCGFRAGDISQMIENLVYVELRRKYAKVYVGDVSSYEVDFVAENASETFYFQVTNSCNDPKTFEREVRSLLALKDNYPKFIISLENVYSDNYDGIKIISLMDFLLGKY
jgi:predicted AAA+ superfamily ATPase